MRHCHKPHWGCQKPVKEIVHPTTCNVVHHCTEETVKHIHPSHTTVMNHHLVKNQHVYPHSTSVQNTYDEVDVFGGAYNTGPGNQVGGAMSPGYQGSGEVAGAKSPGYAGMGHGMKCCKKRRHNW